MLKNILFTLTLKQKLIVIFPQKEQQHSNFVSEFLKKTKQPEIIEKSLVLQVLREFKNKEVLGSFYSKTFKSDFGISF